MDASVSSDGRWYRLLPVKPLSWLSALALTAFEHHLWQKQALCKQGKINYTSAWLGSGNALRLNCLPYGAMKGFYMYTLCHGCEGERRKRKTHGCFSVKWNAQFPYGIFISCVFCLQNPIYSLDDIVVAFSFSTAPFNQLLRLFFYFVLINSAPLVTANISLADLI